MNNTNKKVGIVKIPHRVLKSLKTPKLRNMIYMNFIHLANTPHLMHKLDEIQLLINSSSTQLFVYLYDNKIIGYAIGEHKILNDGRQVFFLTYLYTAKKFRSKGIASKLLQHVENVVRQSNMSYVMLICNTKAPVLQWYSKRQYMLDLQLRRYEQYDVLSKRL
jgi:GNAT superfamily N-acetyltransferase